MKTVLFWTKKIPTWTKTSFYFWKTQQKGFCFEKKGSILDQENPTKIQFVSNIAEDFKAFVVFNQNSQ